MVLEIDRDKERVSLGLKQRFDNPWEKIADKYPVDSEVGGKITTLVPYGAFVELEPGIEGLVHISEITDERIEDPSQILEAGQKCRAEVIQMDANERRIGLSIKSARRQDELADAQGFQNASQAGATLGDLLGDKFKGGDES